MTQETKMRLLGLLDKARAVTRAALADFDPAREVSPGWTVREMAAHLTAWDEATIEALRAHLDGQPYDNRATRDMDAYNARFIAAQTDHSFEAILAECDEARARLKALVETVPPDRFADDVLFPWGPRGTVAYMIEVIGGHEIHHASEISILKT